MDRELLKEAGAESTVEALLTALKGRVDSYEIYFSAEKGFGVEVKDGAVDSLKVRSSAGVGLRTISEGRLGFGFSSVLTEDALAELASRTVDGSRETSPDESLGFPAPRSPRASASSLGLLDESYGKTPEKDKIETALLLERSAKDFEPRVKRVRRASYQESLRSSMVVNSSWVDVKSSATFFSASVSAVAEQDGESQIGWDMGMGHKRGMLDPSTIGTSAAKNAVRMLGARKIKTVKCPAVFENMVVLELLEALSSSFLADNVHKGRSMLAGKIDRLVASPAITLWDDGLLPDGWASSSFDGEGMARQTTALITKGVCRGYLYDTYWAARAKAASTGSASRSGYKAVPAVGISNLYMEKGDRPLEGLLKDIEKGLFITEVMGSHTINSVSGDFSLGAAGFWVEGGKLAYPVRGMAISGNLLGLLSRAGGCGSDLRFIGSIGAPSLLITELEASGL